VKNHFSNRGNLNIHIKAKHTKETFNCTDCDLSFPYKHTLQRHKRKIHDIQEENTEAPPVTIKKMKIETIGII